LRNAVFELVKALSRGDVATILALIEPADPEGVAWNRQRIESLLDAYFADHERIRLDPEARAAKHTRISEEDPRRLIVEQTLVDPEELNDWSLKIAIDLDRCDAEGAIVMTWSGSWEMCGPH
jgi:hypothetical protein